MTKISRLIQLLPCARLQDFPTHLNGHLAAGVLANWTAAWHPSLISATGSAPIVFGTDKTSVEDEHEQDPDLDSFENEPDEPPPSFDAEFWRDSLVFVPEISLESIVQGFAAKAVGENARLITGMTDRNEIIQRAFHLVDAPAAPEQTSNGLEGRVQDFYALAYAYLQIQLLTRKIRFSSNLDQVAFDKRLVAAAKAFSDSDDSLCDAEINSCYDLLLEEKNNYYPVKPTLIDLVLTTPKTVGARFEKETDGKHVVNFLMAWQPSATPPKTNSNQNWMSGKRRSSVETKWSCRILCCLPKRRCDS